MIRAEKQCCRRRRRSFRSWLPSPPRSDEIHRPPENILSVFVEKSPSCQGPFPGRKKAGKAERQERHAGEIIPPAPPCFCLAAAPLRQDRVNGKIMRRLFGLHFQCLRVLTDPQTVPTPVRLCRTVVSKEGISRAVLSCSDVFGGRIGVNTGTVFKNKTDTKKTRPA